MMSVCLIGVFRLMCMCRIIEEMSEMGNLMILIGSGVVVEVGSVIGWSSLS